ncbi:MAG: RNA polymerase sigma factor [Chitinophagales bacterium]
MPDLLTDIDLWRSFKQGDRDAFGALFRRHYSMLFQYGVKLSPERTTVEDCIQELFTELWQNKPAATVHSVKAYLLTSVKYKLFKFFRDNPAAKPVEELNDSQGFEIGHDTFIIGREEDHQKAESMLSALNRLPARQKEIIYLRIYQSLEYEEISEVMDINYQVARNLFSQSIKSLRKFLSAT